MSPRSTNSHGDANISSSDILIFHSGAMQSLVNGKTILHLCVFPVERCTLDLGGKPKEQGGNTYDSLMMVCTGGSGY